MLINLNVDTDRLNYLVKHYRNKKVDLDLQILHCEGRVKREIIKQYKEVLTGSGVYLFRNDSNKIVYVGLAENFYNRLKSTGHNMWYPKTVRGANSVEIIEIESDKVTYLVESMLIDKLKPVYNYKTNSGDSYYTKLINECEYRNEALKIVDTIK